MWTAPDGAAGTESYEGVDTTSTGFELELAGKVNDR